MEIKKDEYEKYVLQDENKCMSFSNSFLGDIYVDFYYTDRKDLWFIEHFDIRKNNELYSFLDSIFFSYGGYVLCSDVNDPHTFMDLYVSTSDP